ncbi:MAG TPA: hypothetical protein VD968_11745 [Pyrinomonadaceae bacterium]|nr:hypothetical protein [Pyrinomonadaceae bacterium]
MNTSPAANLRRRAAGVSLVAAPLLLLASTVYRFGLGRNFEWYATMKLSFFFFAVGALGLVHLLRGRADGSSLVGGALTLAGCLSGASLTTAVLILMTIQEGGLDPAALQTIERALNQFGGYRAIVLCPLPGPLFPAGLLILAVALWRKRVVPAWAALAFAAGAILFPAGRAAGVVWAFWVCDVLLSVSLGYIGWHVLTMTAEEWERRPEARPEVVETV